jgi:shikimate dehydrogenase
MCAVIGWPVTHSFSPAMHNAAFAHLSLPYAYAALPVKPGEVAVAVAGARALGFAGLNVTVPHKEEALTCCSPDATAQAVGAVNTITFSTEQTLGSNTDVFGLDCAIDAVTEHPPQRALILGAGGAARAAVYVLAARGVAFSLLARGARTIDVAGKSYEVEAASQLGESGIARVFAEADLVIDATPLGLGDDPTPWPVHALPGGAAVIDLVVRRETPLSRAATARGLRTAVGDVMLLQQGAAAFRLFTGLDAPVEVMRSALHAAMGRA